MGNIPVMSFLTIRMKLKNGKKLYLAEDKYIGKNDEKMLCKWVTNKKKALGFDTEREAEAFALDYFKNFKDYDFEWCDLYDRDFR